ncbi:hypothetical protein L3Q82_019750 [Scortum barcoo]|uniref:Uncharacterized protein n=1 Tax=Scortum barcoo TaxID=214431 RepID=A0ACB8VE80_9TELE|nr:hypothetical protein L3Q82_019750 [Scortum barcoo]
MDSRILCSFYRCTIESILTGCITAWYSSCTALNRKALQRVVKAAQHITRTELPSMEDLYTPSGVGRRPPKSLRTPVTPATNCSAACCRLADGSAAFEPEPPGSGTASYPQAIRLLNCVHNTPPLLNNPPLLLCIQVMEFPEDFNQLELLNTHGHLIPRGASSLWTGSKDKEEEVEEEEEGEHSEEWYLEKEEALKDHPKELILWAAENNRKFQYDDNTNTERMAGNYFNYRSSSNETHPVKLLICSFLTFSISVVFFQLSTVHRLLTADLSLVLCCDEDGYTPLHRAAAHRTAATSMWFLLCSPPGVQRSTLAQLTWLDAPSQRLPLEPRRRGK